MNRKVFVALCVVALATSAAAAGHRTPLGEALKTQFLAATPAATAPARQPGQGRPAGEQPPQRPVPPHAVYNEFFFHVNFLRKKAAKEEADGKDAKPLRSFYKRQAELDDAQNLLVDKAAADLERELERVDKKVAKIIEKFRADVQAMEIAPGQRPPDPPAELRGMQEERDALVMSALEGLRANLGGEAFGRLDRYIQQHIAPRMTALRVDRPRPENPNRPR